MQKKKAKGRNLINSHALMFRQISALQAEANNFSGSTPEIAEE
jgi:hypothetical protein